MVSVAYGSATLYTASDTSYEFVGGLSIPATQAVEAFGIAAAAAETYTPRGNRANTPSFTVRRVFSTVELAELFCHDHLASMPTSGDLLFTYASSVVRRYAGACITYMGTQQSANNGRVVSISYQFAAGVVANS